MRFKDLRNISRDAICLHMTTFSQFVFYTMFSFCSAALFLAYFYPPFTCRNQQSFELEPFYRIEICLNVSIFCLSSITFFHICSCLHNSSAALYRHYMVFTNASHICTYLLAITFYTIKRCNNYYYELFPVEHCIKVIFMYYSTICTKSFSAIPSTRYFYMCMKVVALNSVFQL